MSSKNSKRKIERKKHIRDYELNDYVFVTQEWIENGGTLATVGLFYAKDIDCKNKHLSLIIYPMKYTYHDGGCEMKELGYVPS